MNFVTGQVKDKESGQEAASHVNNDINVVMSVDTKEKYYGKDTTLETEVGNKVAEGAAMGGAVGSAAGATLAVIADIGSTFVFPGLGIIVASPLAAAIAGAGAGGVTAGLVGALIGLGIPEDRLKEYQQKPSGVENPRTHTNYLESEYDLSSKRTRSAFKNEENSRSNLHV